LPWSWRTFAAYWLIPLKSTTNTGCSPHLECPLIGGLISEREIVHAITQHGERALSMAVLDVMTRSAITVTPGDTLKRAMSLMTNHRVRHLIVIANGQLVGIVSIGDVVKYRLEDLEAESNVLRDAYIAAH
jgi:signal-transduction protein with cAMP-binding, CBS, and nucleotidyltransferase domain